MWTLFRYGSRPGLFRRGRPDLFPIHADLPGLFGVLVGLGLQYM